MFRAFLRGFCFSSGIGYGNAIMADQKQNPEFLGGVPKFNSVGKDTRGLGGAEEPVVPVSQTGTRLRIAAAVAAVILLAALLLYLNERGLGTTSAEPTGGRHAVSTEAGKPTADPNLK